jgi:hypothetical protein
MVRVIGLVIPQAEALNQGDIGPLGVLGRRFRSNAPRAPSPVVNTRNQQEMVL